MTKIIRDDEKEILDIIEKDDFINLQTYPYIQLT